ncbi:GNAT family N-acetyltransferase [Streptomyces sp. NPDC127038]|uniref:GNAT family N-acetyltransferase n=1 Tax=Streptomyces sp. NPDC127038 TaxID=3347114 RepID=UPI00364BBFC0
MSDLTLRPATDEDLPALVRLRDAAARWMNSRGTTGQWQPGELAEDHFRRIMEHGEVWIAELDGRTAGAWELWWSDEAAWGAQPPTAGYVHRLMTDHTHAPPGTGRHLLRAAEHRITETGRTHSRLDCLTTNTRLTDYYLTAGYRITGHKHGKPQPTGNPKSFTLLEKRVG